MQDAGQTKRVDGREKVTGAARYAGDIHLPGMVHAALVQAPVAHAWIVSIDANAARQAPGVLALFTDACFGPELPAIQPPPEKFSADFPAERRAPLSDRVIHYAGQHVALVVATTLEQATEAAKLVRVEYEVLAASNLMLRAALPGTYKADHFATNTQEELNSTRGDRPTAAFALVESAFHTPVVHHNPMEPSATVAVWDGDTLTLHDSTRWVKGSQHVLAHMLGLPEEKVRVLAPFIGGAFGSKGFLWQHVALVAQAARVLERPVKLVLTRAEMFTSVGHRPETLQQVSLMTQGDGKLTGVEHHTISATSTVAHFVEPCGLTSSNLYRTPHAAITQLVAPLHRSTPCFMRAPGEAPGMFALEVAMDELAERLGMDPVELRRRNEAECDLQENKPWSSRHLLECFERGAALFGWAHREGRPGSMRSGRKRLGWGMATAAYPARRSEASVRGIMRADGTAVFSAATQAIGTGVATVMRQVAADALGWPLERVRFELGDSQLPKAPVTGASQTTATLAPAVEAAARALRAALCEMGGGKLGLAPDAVRLENGKIQGSGRAVDLSALLEELPDKELSREAHEELTPESKERHTFHSFGAHFCEVLWDADAAELRVTRWVSVLDCGRVLNPVTARSQIQGAVLFGLGMALMEETHYDPRTGAPVNPNLAEYHLVTAADIPEFTVEFVEHADLAFNPFGVRGLGEIGITGAPAAVANAVYHATGARMHSLPLTPDRIFLARQT